jgi:hypothetical protein
MLIRDRESNKDAGNRANYTGNNLIYTEKSHILYKRCMPQPRRTRCVSSIYVKREVQGT